MKQPVFSQNMVAGFNDRKENAVVRMVQSYQPAITYKVKQATNSSFETEDLVSEIFLKILNHSRRFETLRNIENFIDRVTANTCKDFLRKKEVRRNNSDGLKLHLQNLEDYNAETALTDHVFICLLQFVIEQFPRQRREIFLLYYRQGMKNAEIAKHLGISEKTVENHKNLAFRALKAVYRDRETGGDKFKILLIFLIFLPDWLLR